MKVDGAAIVEVVGGGRDHQEQQSVVSQMVKPMPMPRQPMKGPSSWMKMMIEMPMPIIGAAQLYCPCHQHQKQWRTGIMANGHAEQTITITPATVSTRQISNLRVNFLLPLSSRQIVDGRRTNIAFNYLSLSYFFLFDFDHDDEYENE